MFEMKPFGFSSKHHEIKKFQTFLRQQFSSFLKYLLNWLRCDPGNSVNSIQLDCRSTKTSLAPNFPTFPNMLKTSLKRRFNFRMWNWCISIRSGKIRATSKEELCFPTQRRKPRVLSVDKTSKSVEHPDFQFFVLQVYQILFFSSAPKKWADVLVKGNGLFGNSCERCHHRPSARRTGPAGGHIRKPIP